MNKIVYLRTDKNGTKIYHDYTCHKCRGAGYIPAYSYIDGGICFKCGGSGENSKPTIIKTYTAEHKEKLTQQREKRLAKKIELEKSKAAAYNAEFFENNAFNKDGKTYFIIGCKFEDKDRIKELGGKWDSDSKHWRLSHTTELFNTVEVDVDEIYYKDYAGRYNRKNWKVEESSYQDIILKAEKSLCLKDDTTSFIGSIGDRLSIAVTYIGSNGFDNPYSQSYYAPEVIFIHKFKDNSGNLLIWKTSNAVMFSQGSKLSLVGTVKEHNVYKTAKQTILTRCKLKEENLYEVMAR